MKKIDQANVALLNGFINATLLNLTGMATSMIRE